MKRNVFALFLLILCLFSLSFGRTGFAKAQNGNEIYESNAFRIIRQADDSGKIGLSYIFPVGTKLLEEKNFSQNEILTYRFYLSTYVNALAKQNRNKAVAGMEVSNCMYFSDVDGLGFSIVFDSVQVQKQFFGSEENDGEEDENASQNIQTSGFFMKKVKICTTFPVSSKKSAEDLKAICNMAISSWAADNHLSDAKKTVALETLQDSVFIYDFATTQKGLKSEMMYDDENFHHNVFVKTLADIEEDNQIVFYTTYPNTPVWYAAALVVVILAMIVAYVVLSKKRRSK